MSTTSLFALSYLYFQSTAYGYTINTVTDNQYYHSNISCINTESCDITCNEYYSCAQSTINCPSSDHSCSITCGNQDSFTCGTYSTTTRTVINCPSNAQCDIQCIGGNSCHSMLINWPQSGPGYSITCSGYQSCAEVDFNWPSWGPKANALICSGYNGCFGTDILSPNDNQPFTFECNNVEACYSSTITCPKYSKCTIICSESSACVDTNIIWPDHYDNAVLICSASRSCSRTNFPIPPATTPYTLLCDSSKRYCNSAEITCPSSADCTIFCTAKYACNNAKIICPSEGYKCNIDCVSDACTGTKIYFDDMNDIICVNSTYLCKGASFYPQNNSKALYIDCSSVDCADIKITMPSLASLTVTCNGTNPCNNTVISAINGVNDWYSPLTVYCNDDACNGMKVSCPSTSCNIYCNNANSCTNMYISGSFSRYPSLFCRFTTSCNGVIVYLWGSTKQKLNSILAPDASAYAAIAVKIECGSLESQRTHSCGPCPTTPYPTKCSMRCDGTYSSPACLAITVHCGTLDCSLYCGHTSCEGSTVNATLSTHFSCVGTGCSGLTNILSGDSTLVPTDGPSVDPSSNPTFIPTFFPTSNPTFHPTFVPTSIPTTHPTPIPTLKPTSVTFKPTVLAVNLTANPLTPSEIWQTNASTLPSPIFFFIFMSSTGNNEAKADKTLSKTLDKRYIVMIIVGVSVLFCCLVLVFIKWRKGINTKNMLNIMMMQMGQMTETPNNEEYILEM